MGKSFKNFSDAPGKWLLENLKASGTDVDGLIKVPGRRTSLKTRVIANKQQVVRIDNEITDKISKDIFKVLIDRFKSKKASYDAIVISDYYKGVVTEELLNEITEISDDRPVLVDPKVNNFKYYKNVHLITPNANEACFYTQIPFEEDKKSVLEAGREIIRRLNCEHLLITRGEYGMVLFENSDTIIDIPTVAKEVSDVSGAGDTVISAMALGIASGAKLEDCARISNIASGIVVGKLGTASVGSEELLSALNF